MLIDISLDIRIFCNNLTSDKTEIIDEIPRNIE